MIAQVDINTLASWSAVLAAVCAALGVHRKAGRWLDSVDARFERQAEEMDRVWDELGEHFERQAAETDLVWDAFGENRTEVRQRLDEIDAQLRPNGGGSHHDLVLKAVRAAVEEASKRDRKRGRRAR